MKKFKCSFRYIIGSKKDSILSIMRMNVVYSQEKFKYVTKRYVHVSIYTCIYIEHSCICLWIFKKNVNFFNQKDEKVNKSILLIFSEITLSTQRTLSIVYCTKETEFPAWRGKCIASLSVPKRSSMSKKAHRPGFTSSKILFRCIRD